MPDNRDQTTMIRILIADDHAIVRAGLKQFIADQPDMVVKRRPVAKPSR